MKNLNQFLVAFLTLGFLVPAAPALAGKAYTQAELNKLWHQTGKKERKLVTSNSTHFWAWAKNEAEGYVGDYLAPEGVVIGDPHPRNVFDYRNGGKAKLAVADIDDGGQAPLFLDIVRLIVYTETLDMKIKISEIFDAYVDGLRGSKIAEPDAMADARAESQRDIEAGHAKYIDKHTTSKGMLDLKELDLTGQDDFSASQKKALAALSKIALKNTGFAEVVDAGFKVNDSGSSLGMDRYWLLLGKNGEGKLLLEFKELGRSAVSYYQRQAGTEARVKEVLDVYSDDGLNDEKFGVVTAAGKEFWMRPRHYQALDLDDEDLSSKDQKEFAEYTANWIGLSQRSQADGKKLLKLIEKDRKTAKEALEEMVRAYLEEIRN